MMSNRVCGVIGLQHKQTSAVMIPHWNCGGGMGNTGSSDEGVEHLNGCCFGGVGGA